MKLFRIKLYLLLNFKFLVMNKKFTFLLTFAFISFLHSYAGGILTNTNQSARFARLFALEASTNTDAAYYNPAGTIKLSDGFHFSFSNQSAFQERKIKATFPPFATGVGNDKNPTKDFIGKASAPIIPSFQAVYRVGNWALSGAIGITGGGGKATFNDGLPMFEAPISLLPSVISSKNLAFPNLGSIKPTTYSMDSHMKGTNYIFGAQLGGAYKINDMFSVYGGFRLNIVHNKYEGYIRDVSMNLFTASGNNSMINVSDAINSVITQMGTALPPAKLEELTVLAASTANKELESKQSGWGVAPILGLHFSWEKLNIGVKYEFKTALDVENNTKRDDTGLFKNGVNTAHDIPALFSIGASYQLFESLTINLGYHHFFDKNASMANDKQKALKSGTNEYLFGAEYKINKLFLVSAGGQVTRYGMADGYQSDLSFSVNSYSLGFGGAVNVSEKVQINVGYFFTDYSNFNMNTPVSLAGNKVAEYPTQYTRTNKVFTAGVDFRF